MLVLIVCMIAVDIPQCQEVMVCTIAIIDKCIHAIINLLPVIVERPLIGTVVKVHRSRQVLPLI